MKDRLKELIVLYAEDDSVILDQASTYLKKHCKDVLTAKDGLEALDTYKLYNPDIVISDIKMPKLDGIALARAIRRVDKKTPIILATAYSDNAYLIKAVELQLIKYLIKPITPTALLDALLTAMEHIHSDNQSVDELGDNIFFDHLNRALHIDGEVVELTKKESKLLSVLARHKGNSVSYETIEQSVWHDSYMSYDTLRSLVRNLRKKVPALKIENISGLGYRLQ